MPEPRFLIACSLVALLAIGACTRQRAQTTPMPIKFQATVQPGACGEPGRDGVMSERPELDRADRDLDGDGLPEILVVDRAMCSALGNCYWNVFRTPRVPGECARFAGTFAGAALEPLETRGEDGMVDVRAYWNQDGGRMLLQSYRYVRDGYRIDDVLQCKRQADDRLDCTDTDR
jgi:hypothetical protein